MPDRDGASATTPLYSLLHGVPRAYAILFFSPNARLGRLLLVISLLSPGIGLSGLAGAFAAGGIAWALGFDRAAIRNGYLLFNPLLVCLTLGLMDRSYFFPPQIFLALWVAAVLGGLFTAVAMQHAFSRHFGLSAQSLPAMAFAYVLYFLAFAIAGPATMPVEMANPWLDLGFLPSWGQSFFQIFGAMIFEPRALPGLLVFIALITTSPLSTLLASASLVFGLQTLNLLGYHAGHDGVIWCGFNFLLCGIALGTAYFAPSRMSLLLALTGTFLCALVTLALATALRYFGLPASALPYNLVVLVLIYALRQRHAPAGLHPSPAPGMLPETAGRFVVLNASRFPHLQLPALDLPFKDECVITQGVNGSMTHRAPWNWALDFEVLSQDQRCHRTGAALDDYHTFNKLVLAPCAGTVAAVKAHVPDNAPGANNPEENWGNYVVIHSDAGYHVLLAHLRQGSPLVCAGRRIVCGEPIGHCGNSGRSPVPHLHLQIQDTAYPGGPTRPFCLRNIIEINPAGTAQTYHTSLIPPEGARLARPTPLPALHALFCNWLPGEYRYRISLDNQAAREETLRLDFDEMGRFRLRSRRHAAQLTAFLSQNVFYTVDYEGPRDSLLALISAGLARVPCLADPGVVWDDHVSPSPFYGGVARKLHDIADPYLGPNLRAYRYSMQAGEHGFEVRCELKSDAGNTAPHRISTTLNSRFGIRRIEAQLGNDAVLRAELIDPLLPPEKSETRNDRQKPSSSFGVFSRE
ncbi:MAG TPA: urea transporter [Candidatus Methylacidiphilales bacterium]|nr:urea transporter [Candidatus Methylacidiphilales bacterium]